ncbi:MAG: DUF4124 domain-containing protein [Gammaproteobacteria bacterium]|nr:DUF4124 domain-containing protein [Gammaproteobacteria bacterium]
MQYTNNLKRFLIRKLLILCLLTPALLCLSVANAGLYKGQDAEGNTAYSDTPFRNAKEITPPNISVVDAPNVPVKANVVEEKDVVTETKYTKFKIIAPKNNATIWNEPQLTVSLQLKPDLDIASGHNVWLIMDGKPLIKNQRSLKLQIGRADRGSHTIKAQIRNKKGKVIRSSKTISIHIKNTVVQRTVPN